MPLILHNVIEHHKTATTQPIVSNLLQDLQKNDHSKETTGKESGITSTNASSTSTSFFEQITPVTPLTEPSFTLTTDTSSIQQLSQATVLAQGQSEHDKEYTTELSQHGKLSITIRLQQKDKEQSSSSSPEHHMESDKLSEDNQNSSNSTDLPSNYNNKPLTRKSARLMSQVNKTTIDEVIEDVVKGIFNEDSHDYSLSAIENQEYQDLEEEIDSNPSENEMEKSDEYSFDHNEENLSTSSKQQSTTKETSNSNNSSLNKSFGRVTRSSVKNVNDKDQSITESNQPSLETVELKLPNAIISTSITSSNTTSLVDSVISTNQSQPITSTTTSSSTKVTAKQHTVMKVEIPKSFTKTNNSNDQQTPAVLNKSIDEIKKEDNSNTSSIDPLISKLSSSSITATTTKPLSTSNTFLPSQSVVTTATPVIQDQKPNISTIIQPNIIPTVSERMHNSQTPLKLKTGKFNLEDYNLSSSQNTSFVSSTEQTPVVITNTSTSASIPTSLAKPLYTVEQQSCMPTSVVVTSSIGITTTSQPISLSSSTNNSNIAITSAPSPFKDATDLKSLNAQQMRMKGAKTPQQQQPILHQQTAISSNVHQQQLLNSISSPFPSAGQMPIADYNPMYHQQLLMQMQNHPYLAALHNSGLQLGSGRLPVYPPFNTQAMANEKDLLLEDCKLKGKIVDSIVDSSMHPPPPLSSIRCNLPGTAGLSSLPNTSFVPVNYPLIRTPIPPHLLSPHDQNSAANSNQSIVQQQQRFTESPVAMSYGRAPLMSPNLKVDIKPQLMPSQRPQSTFNMPSGPINSPSPITVGSASSAQLSPNLVFRRDMQSPMSGPSQSNIDLSCNNSNESTGTAMHPRKLHHRYAKEQQQQQQQLMSNVGPYQMHPNINLLPSNFQQQLAASMQQQQLAPQATTPIQTQPPIQQVHLEQQDPSNSGGDSVLIQRYPKMWQGILELKNDRAAVQMHFVTGNPLIAQNALPPMLADGKETIPLKIAQRMRLEPQQLDGVYGKMQQMDQHCMLLALPCGRDEYDVIEQSNNLKVSFIQYLQSKEAAGIVNSNAPGTNTHAYVVHIFPSCDFSNKNLEQRAPDLLKSIAEFAHLLVVIATV